MCVFLLIRLIFILSSFTALECVKKGSDGAVGKKLIGPILCLKNSLPYELLIAPDLDPSRLVTNAVHPDQ